MIFLKGKCEDMFILSNYVTDETASKSSQRSIKTQSAMEYLMTYGWAILIVAVVLGVLFQLGVFNGANFAPKVPPGGCHVFRPNGPGTTFDTTLLGNCANELPEYVAQFNGQTSYIDIPQLNQETGTNPMSFTVWFDVLSLPGSWPMIFGDTSGTPREGYDIYVKTSTDALVLERFYGGHDTAKGPTGGIALNTWYFAAGTYDGGTLSLYLNGKLLNSTGDANSITPDSIMSIGAGSGWANFGNYEIADFQVYDTAFDANAVNYLYLEGIGGVPVSPQYLVGWWPLNGDSNDYSGNGDNGVSNIVAFNGTWMSTYTPP
jgi:hypothetical protein